MLNNAITGTEIVKHEMEMIMNINILLIMWKDLYK